MPDQQRTLKDAIEYLHNHDDPTKAPPVWVAREVNAGLKLPYDSGSFQVIRVDVTEGRPDHGALRSDAHISHWEVAAGLSALRGREEITLPVSCPDCGAHGGVYRYHANHHIAGYERAACEACGKLLDSNDWG